jgi:hypothetical protein
MDSHAYVRHAVRYGCELVVETARQELAREANSRRQVMPGPVDLTWLPERERERLLDERIAARSVFRAWLEGEMQAVERLPAEIALVRRKAGKPSAAASRQRRSTPALREQVVGLHERGLLPTVIADTLNVSDRRVRELLRAAGYRRNGHRKRLVQARVFAAKPVAEVI